MVGKSAGLGRPLRVPTFRNLLIADLVSDIGTFMQSVGAAWLMVSLSSHAAQADDPYQIFRRHIT
jgi:transmembrane secretion effector